MAIDARIPLAVNPPPDWLQNQQGLMTLANLQQKFQANQTAMQAQNAMKNVFADKNNLTPEGTLKPEALQQIMAISPEYGMQMQKMSTANQLAQAQVKGANADLTIAGHKMIEDEVRTPSAIAYQRAIDRGLSPAQAQEIAQKVYTDGISSAKQSGLFSEEQIAQFPPNFDFQRVSANSQRYLTMEEQKRKDALAEKREDREAGYQRASLGIQAANVNLARDRFNWEKNKPELGTVQNVEIKGPDGKVQEVPAVEDKRTGQWYSADQNRTPLPAPTRVIHPSVYGEGSEWDPDAVSLAVQENIVSGTNPQFGGGNAGAKNRAAYQAERARLQRESGLSPGDFALQVASGRAEVKSDFISLNQLTKMYDGTVAFENTMKRNMQNALELLPKAGTSEWGPFVNKLRNYILTNEGDPDTKAAGGALMAGMTEFAKVVGGGAMSSAAITEGARQEAMRMLSIADSPRAIKKFYEDVMIKDAENKKDEYGNQRDAIKARIQGVKLPSAGDRPTAPKSDEAAPKSASGSSVATPSSKADYDALPSGARYRKPSDPEGSYRVKP
jgi:hypothetical protein